MPPVREIVTLNTPSCSLTVPPDTLKAPPRSFSLISTDAVVRGPRVEAAGGCRLLRVTVKFLSDATTWLSTSRTVKLWLVTPASNVSVPAVFR